jgi:hypothetical protein
MTYRLVIKNLEIEFSEISEPLGNRQTTKDELPTLIRFRLGAIKHLEKFNVNDFIKGFVEDFPEYEKIKIIQFRKWIKLFALQKGFELIESRKENETFFSFNKTI